MGGLIPESATRLQATMFVRDAALGQIGRVEILRRAAEQMAEQALRKLLEDCVKAEGYYMGYQGQTLRLDVYVLTPAEFHSAIAEARMQGERDAMEWQDRVRGGF